MNISVSDAKDEDPAMKPFRLSEADEEEQKRRFLTPDDPLCFLVVTAKLMTGFDAPNEGVLYLDKPAESPQPVPDDHPPEPHLGLTTRAPRDRNS